VYLFIFERRAVAILDISLILRIHLNFLSHISIVVFKVFLACIYLWTIVGMAIFFWARPWSGYYCIWTILGKINLAVEWRLVTVKCARSLRTT
jgi:hypothetical protein